MTSSHAPADKHSTQNECIVTFLMHLYEVPLLKLNVDLFVQWGGEGSLLIENLYFTVIKHCRGVHQFEKVTTINTCI